LLFLFATEAAHAGRLRRVAGSSCFRVSKMGLAAVRANGQVTYYSDQCDRSPEVSQSQADAMVAAAAVWNAVPTAAVSIRYRGDLAEDVDESITVNAGGGITLPADVQPGATQDPSGVVHDQTGAVIDGLCGAGASSPLECETSGVISELDNVATTAGQIETATVGATVIFAQMLYAWAQPCAAQEILSQLSEGALYAARKPR
jgi:hypothetical protein